MASLQGLGLPPDATSAEISAREESARQRSAQARERKRAEARRREAEAGASSSSGGGARAGSNGNGNGGGGSSSGTIGLVSNKKLRNTGGTSREWHGCWKPHLRKKASASL